MNEKTWAVTPYGPHLEAGVLAFHRRIWGDTEIASADYHRWQYQENPAGQALVGLARDGSTGELVGQFATLPLRVSLDGEPAIAALALNVATDPEYRRRGIFISLARAADEQIANAGVDFAFALPNENSFLGFVQHLGYQHVGDIPLLVRPINLRRIVQQRLALPGLGTLAGALGGLLLQPLHSAATPLEGVAVAPVERFDSAFDALWERISGRQRVMVLRDAAYLDWRFHRIPLRHYQPLQALVDGELAGYIVLREAEIAGMRAGLVVDFVVEPSPAGERAGSALLAHALAHFVGEDLDLLASLMLSHTSEYRLLRRAGFWPLPHPLLPQRFRLVARNGPAVRHLRHWFLTMGDYDVV